jgi:hypothetical protein
LVGNSWYDSEERREETEAFASERLFLEQLRENDLIAVESERRIACHQDRHISGRKVAADRAFGAMIPAQCEANVTMRVYKSCQAVFLVFSPDSRAHESFSLISL